VTTRSRAEAALLATTLIWGGTFAVVKIGMRDVSPLLLIAIRFFLAGALMLLLFRRRLFPIPRQAILKGSILASFLFLGFVTQNIGLTITTASKSAFITGMMVLFVPLLQVIIERRPPRPGNVAGVAIVTLGLWFLTSPAGESFNAGDALTIVCAVLFAVYIVYLDVISKEMTTEQLTVIQMVATGLMALAATALFETPRLVPSTTAIASLVYLTLLATVVTTYVQTRFQKETTPTRAVVIFSIEPVIATVIAYVLLGETLGTLGVLGGALIIAGVLVSEFADTIPFLRRGGGRDDS
jgi:drug/metabolite transporter (DMT)-like permease